MPHGSAQTITLVQAWLVASTLFGWFFKHWVKVNKPTRSSSIHRSREASSRYESTGKPSRSCTTLSCLNQHSGGTHQLPNSAGKGMKPVNRVIRRDLAAPGDSDALGHRPGVPMCPDTPPGETVPRPPLLHQQVSTA